MNKETEISTSNEIPHKKSSKWIQWVSILFTGLGIGWLMGLSISPVVGGVITSLMGIIAGIITIQYGKSEGTAITQKMGDARPVALLVMGIVITSTLGMLARTHHIFDPIEPPGSQSSKTGETPGSDIVAKQGVGGLFAIYKKDCDILSDLVRIGNDKAFVDRFRQSKIPGASEFVDKLSGNPEALKAVFEILKKHYIEPNSKDND